MKENVPKLLLVAFAFVSQNLKFCIKILGFEESCHKHCIHNRVSQEIAKINTSNNNP